MTIEPQGGNQWKYTLKIANQVAQLTQTTVFEDRNGCIGVKRIRRIRAAGRGDFHANHTRRARAGGGSDAGGANHGNRRGRYAADVHRRGAGKASAGDRDIGAARDAAAGKPLRYRMVDEGRAKPMNFTVAGKETMTIGGKPRQATKLVSTNGSKQMLIWVVEGIALSARILQRKDGKDDIDLMIISVR